MSRRALQEMDTMLRPTLDGIAATRLRHTMGHPVTTDEAHQINRDEYSALCPAHRRTWDDAREDARTVISATPAPITLMHIGGSDLARVKSVDAATYERWLELTDSFQQCAVAWCQRGAGCTITTPVQDALPLEAS